MALVTVVACVLAAFLQGLNGAIAATQTPDSLSVTLGEGVQINCDFTLTISGAPPEDGADFYCRFVNPLTFGSRTALEKKHESSNNLFWRKRLSAYKRKRGLNEDMVATQTPVSLSVTHGKWLKINCKMGSGSNYDSTLTSTGVLAEDDADYYCQVANPLFFGKGTRLDIKRHRREIVAIQTPDSLSVTHGKWVKINCNMNSGSNYDSTLTFNGVLAEDPAFYYCHVVAPLTFGSGTTLKIQQTPDSAPSMFNSMKGKPLTRQRRTTSPWVTCRHVGKGMERA